MKQKPVTFDLEHNTLTIAGDLDWSVVNEFDEYCRLLLECESEALRINLTGLSILTSQFLGILMQTAIESLEQSRALSLEVPARLLSLFHALGFEKFATLKVM